MPKKRTVIIKYFIFNTEVDVKFVLDCGFPSCIPIRKYTNIVEESVWEPV